MTHRCNQLGRSMVEMLGTLAIVGILSMVGIKAFHTGILQHRANELINEANKRAVMVAAQIMAGRDNLSVSEFNNPEGYLFDVKKWNNNQFAILLTKADSNLIDEDICQKIRNTVGTSSPLRQIGKNCLHLVFNNDLSTNDIEEQTACTTDTQCDFCEKCQEGYCVKRCQADQFCAMGNSNQDYACVNIPDGCADCTERQWCNISSSNCRSDSTYTGECVNIESQATFEARKKDLPLPTGGTVTVYQGSTMSWWAAKNFCEAHGKRMVRLSTLGLKEQTCASGCVDAMGNALTEEYINAFNQKINTWSWTGYVASSCGAYAISSSNTTLTVRALGKYYPYVAVCE